MIHVIPVNDLREHTESDDCHCRPEIDGETCVHTAFDFRHLLEQAVETEDSNKSLNSFGWYMDKIWSLVSAEEVTTSWARERSRLAFLRVYAHWLHIGVAAFEAPPSFDPSDFGFDVNNPLRLPRPKGGHGLN